MNAAANATLPAQLTDNPSLDRWVTFPRPGVVGVSTGRVEIGQGVLTAMLQMAAEELDVSPGQIELRSGRTDLTPNEGYTAGSQSIQFGGIALQQACAEVRGLLLAQAARKLNCDASDLRVQEGIIHRGNAATTGLDYWTLSTEVDLAVPPTGAAPRKHPQTYSVVGKDLPRTDLPAKVFGEAAYIHDMVLQGMRHARVVRQPQRAAKLENVDEAAIRRAAKGDVQFVRYGNFLAIVGDDETAVELAAVAASQHVKWSGVEQKNPQAAEASWLLQQPHIDRPFGAPEAAPTGGERYEATYSRAHLAHASISPSCGLATFENGKLTVWTHCQGVFPLRAALARSLKLDVKDITVIHAQGAGCYGHNGADDAAADAATIAMRMPGVPIRVRWRREEEFAYEPMSPAMVVKVRAELDAQGKPSDWTAEIWSCTHNTRPGAGGVLLAAEAYPDPPPQPQPDDVPEAHGGGATRNGVPLYDIPATRMLHHLVVDAPVRTSALRGLGAMPNVFAIECFLDELAERAGVDSIDCRLSIQNDPRARAVIERVAQMANWQKNAPSGTGRGRGIGFSKYKNRAAYSAVVVDLEVDETIRIHKMWCATDGGVIVSPDGAINQLEGGMLQAMSWVLKEQVRIEDLGVSSIDWESYPVLKFSEVPEIDVELIQSYEPPLGIGEATAGPTAAAIGNAASHALGARLRELPLTRERIMATLLAQ